MNNEGQLCDIRHSGDWPMEPEETWKFVGDGHLETFFACDLDLIHA
jgi:hypothetical protein